MLSTHRRTSRTQQHALGTSSIVDNKINLWMDDGCCIGWGALIWGWLTRASLLEAPKKGMVKKSNRPGAAGSRGGQGHGQATRGVYGSICILACRLRAVPHPHPVRCPSGTAQSPSWPLHPHATFLQETAGSRLQPMLASCWLRSSLALSWPPRVQHGWWCTEHKANLLGLP